MKKPKVFIAYPHPGLINHGFHFSLLRAAMTTADYQTFISSVISGVSIARARNHLTKVFLATEYDYMLMCDTDGAWPPSAIKKLIDDDVPIVAGHALGQEGDGSLFSAVLDFRDGALARRPVGEGLTKVAAVGMHFTLIKREVLETLGVAPMWPFQATAYQSEEQHTISEIGEDATFCLRAASKGFDTYVDYRVPIGHEKPRVLWPEGTSLDPLELNGIQTLALVDPDSEEASRINEEYGTHMASLKRAVEATDGPILEIGTGVYSTPYLHEVSKTGRLVISVEADSRWFNAAKGQYASRGHRVLEAVPATGEFDVVLIDHDPEDLRMPALEALRGRFTYAVIHDTQPDTPEHREWKEVLSSFAHSHVDDSVLPWTTTVSDVRPIPP